MMLAFPTAVHLLTYSATHTSGDPRGVGIEDLGREINPKAAILKACSAAIVNVGHVEDHEYGTDGRYQSWSVVPRDGHVDRAFLDTKTGRVICP